MTLTDGNAFSNTAIKHVDTFIYSRKYGSTSWVTTVLPVALNYSDWSDNFDIANITGVNVKLNANKQIQSFTVSMSILKAGSTTNPNQPYLIRAKVANTNTSQSIRKTNCDVYPATPKELVFTSGDYKITFKGTYKKLTSNIYTSSKEIWSPGTSVGPYRVYASVLKKEQEVSPEPASEPTPDPSTDPTTDTGYEKLAKNITYIYNELNTAINNIWKFLGENTNNRFATVEEAIYYLDQTSTTLQNKVSALETSISSINVELSALQRRLNLLENQGVSVNTDGDTSNSEYESRIADLENRVGNISFKVTS